MQINAALISSGLMSLQEIETTQQEAERMQMGFIPYAVLYKGINGTAIARACAQHFGLDYIDLTQHDIDITLSETIHIEFIRKHHIVVINNENNTLTIAIHNPTQLALLKELQFHTQLETKAVIACYSQIISLINHFYNHKLHVQVTPTSTSTVIQLVTRVISDAIIKAASDIHFEPQEQQFKIRMRIDGLLQEAISPPYQLNAEIISRLKVLAELDIAEKRLPQDGRFRFTSDFNITRDCRISTCPTLYGEKVVVRLLNPNKQLLKITELGLTPSAQDQVIKTIKQPQGLILVTGPTGSGKTITLYTALQYINEITRNISTIEDPIEINLPNVNQVNVNYKIGLDFAKALRAFLRQDPDVIMIGEIRDLETAQMALRAAQTGHLVFATLHTNSAKDTKNRLINMGVASYNITSSLRLIIAQRLVRKLCDYCKKKQTLPNDALLKIGFKPQELSSLQLFKSGQCTYCHNGYRGRTGIFEVLSLSKEGEEFMEMNLWQAGLHKVKIGETSLDELHRVIEITLN